YILNGIFIDNLRGDTPQLLTYENGFEPKWHPGGDTISYIHSTKGLHFINVSTKKVEKITDYTGGGNHNWNTNGNTILGWKSAAPIGYFTSWNINTKELTEINPLKDSYNTNPVYSPSGTKIAFQADNGIYIINSDGSD